MRLLAGVDRPEDGVRLMGHQVHIDYFAQDQAAVLNPTRTVYEEMTAASPTTMVPLIRNILGGFLFSGDDVYKRVAVLSGGARNRLALAKMLLTPSNVLLLDEPTNHLDLDSKEVLLEALSDYGGTLIFVSHDRYFVDRLAGKVIDVGGGEALVYPGGYEDFVHWKKQREAGVAAPLPTPERKHPAHLKPSDPGVAPGPKGPASEPARDARPPAAGKKKGAPPPPPPYDPLAPRLRTPSPAEDRQAREREARKAKARSAELEKRIAEREQAVKDVESLMATPGFYDDRAAADKVVEERKALLAEVETLMAEWEAAQSVAEMKA
jgi:ATP-binding cassette subfamily F protein 3